jgi:hypothetical protein
MTTLKDRPGHSRAQRADRSEIGGGEHRRSVTQGATPVRAVSQLGGIAHRKSLRPAEAAAVLGVCRETVYVCSCAPVACARSSSPAPG